MRKKFASNLILMLGLNLLIKPFWILGIDRTVQNMMGLQEYGLYYNMFNFSLMLSVFLDFGIANYTSSSIAKQPQKINEQFSVLFVVKIFFSIAYLLFTLCAALFITCYDSHSLYLLFILGVNQTISFFIIFFRSNISGLQLFKTDSLLSVLDRGLMILFCSVLIWGGMFNLSIDTFIYAQTCAYSTSLILVFMVLKPHLNKLNFNMDKQLVFDVLKKTYPYALLALIMMFYTRIDNLMLEKLLPDGYYQIGIYAQSYRLLDAANMFGALIAMLLLPMFSRMIKNNDNIKPMINSGIGVLIAPSIIFSFACYFYQKEIMDLLYPNAFSITSDVFGFVILCFIPISVMYVFGTLLTANSNLKALNILALLALLINFSLNYFLIPEYKVQGAAISALVTQTFIAIGNAIYGYKKTNIKPDYLLWFKLILLALILLLLGNATKLVSMNWMFEILAYSAIGCILIFVLKLIELKRTLDFIKDKLNSYQN